MTIESTPREQHSGVVRFHRAPGAVRATFRVLERTAPELGARWAERIWFTLPRAQGSRDDESTPGREFTLDVDGRPVTGEEWGAGPTIYLMHGWAGRRGHLAAFVAPLVTRGFRVIAFDAPSHGSSAAGAHGPRSSTLPEFVATLAAVVAAQGRAHAVIAHSMGAAAAAIALGNGVPAARLAMLAPMASPASYATQFAGALGFGTRIHSRLITRIERRIAAPLHRFDVPELGRRAAMPPTLIVHDRNDRSMSLSNGVAIAAAWPGSRLHVTSGLGHRRILHDPNVVADVVEFVTA